jgi:alkanesulfonate monooxygenase SsuD/methylene tetrahydromethanopterin reductase-like flavin-dependent oxidoreductase (luciferase family)
MTQLSMRFDLRVPPFAETSFADQHRAMLEMVTWAEAKGFGSIIFSEHHGDPAGYSSAPITLAAAALGRTSRIKVTISAALVPLHDPVRLAEQLATIDCLAPGRLSIVLGAGYRPVEFSMAGVDRAQRGPLLEQCVSVLRSAWSGKSFEWRGREILATPPPATPGGPEIAVGGKTLAGARRAARLHCKFSPAVATWEVIETYFEECERLGFAGAEVYGCTSFAQFREQNPADRPPAPGFVMVTKHPASTWKRIARHAEYDAMTYAAWQEDGVVSNWAVPGADSWEQLRDSGLYAVLTPQECLALAARDRHIMFHPLMGGIAPDLAWESLKLFEAEVLPGLSLSAAS